MSPRGGYFATLPPRIIAHRGLAVGVPENTLLAFLAALDAGADCLETDVRSSADGVAMLSHDPDLTRISGRPLRIDATPADQLRRVPLDAGQSVATLAEALDAFPETPFNIDVKSDDAVGPTIRAVARARAAHRVLITSFDRRRRRAALAGLDGALTSASQGQVARAVAVAKLGWAGGIRRSAEGIDAIQLPERWHGMRLVTPLTVAAWHDAGLEVHVWTVNDPDDQRRLLDTGVDGIITDRADIARAVVDRAL